MMLPKKLLFSALPALLLSSAALAQNASAPPAGAKAGIAAGAKVSDSKGGEVGTVTKVDGEFVILKTDKHEARLPLASLARREGGFAIAMTRDELNAEIEKSMTSAAAKLAPGAAVSGSQGGSVGTIEAVNDQFVTLKLASGKKVRLPRSGITAGADGAVIGLTTAELEAAAAAAGAK